MQKNSFLETVEQMAMQEVEPTAEELEFMEELESDMESRENDSAEEEEVIDNSTSDYMGDSMKQYLSEIGRISLLTLEEEQELGKIIAEGGEGAKAARDKLITANLRLVIHYAKRYIGRGMTLEDLNSMGIEGLMKAVEKYDYTRGFKFSTYASWWITQAISRGIDAESSSMRIPTHMSETIRKVRKAKKMLLQQTGCEPTISQIAGITGFTEQKVLAAVEAMYNIVSMDAKVGEDGDTTIEDFLSDENAPDPCESVVVNDLREAVNRVLGGLPEKEAIVLALRYGIGGREPMTLEEIGKLPELGVSRERVRQIEGRALRMIRQNQSLKSQLIDFVG